MPTPVKARKPHAVPPIPTVPLPVLGAMLYRGDRRHDSRGSTQELLGEAHGFNPNPWIAANWTTVSWSKSEPWVLRGINIAPHATLITCLGGSMIECVVDLRPTSCTYLKYCFVPLNSASARQVLVPAFCGHAYLCLDDGAQVLSLCAAAARDERRATTSLRWDDPLLAIRWPLHLIPPSHDNGSGVLGRPTVSEKDAAALTMAQLKPHFAQYIRIAPVRALIIGASGQVGNALLSAFGRTNCVGTFSTNDNLPGDRMVQFDLAEAAVTPGIAHALLEMVRPTVVCICAGWTWVDGAERDPHRAMAINAHGPAAVAAAAKRVHASVVYYSTEYVFDGSDEHPGPYDEEAPTAPINWFGRSKLEGETLVAAAVGDDSALILRTTVVYGPEQEGKNFVYQLVRRIVGNKGMLVVDDQRSSPTYNRDLADITVTLIELGARGIFNVAGPELMDRYTFGIRVAAALRLKLTTLAPISTDALAQRARRPLRAGLKIDKLLRFLADAQERSAKERRGDGGMWGMWRGGSSPAMDSCIVGGEVAAAVPPAAAAVDGEGARAATQLFGAADGGAGDPEEDVPALARRHFTVEPHCRPRLERPRTVEEAAEDWLRFPGTSTLSLTALGVVAAPSPGPAPAMTMMTSRPQATTRGIIVRDEVVLKDSLKV